MSSPASFPRTARELTADDRFTDSGWRAPDGKTFYQLCEAVHGADKAAELWWAAICLDTGRVL